MEYFIFVPRLSFHIFLFLSLRSLRLRKKMERLFNGYMGTVVAGWHGKSISSWAHWASFRILLLTSSQCPFREIQNPCRHTTHCLTNFASWNCAAAGESGLETISVSLSASTCCEVCNEFSDNICPATTLGGHGWCNKCNCHKSDNQGVNEDFEYFAIVKFEQIF